MDEGTQVRGPGWVRLPSIPAKSGRCSCGKTTVGGRLRATAEAPRATLSGCALAQTTRIDYRGWCGGDQKAFGRAIRLLTSPFGSL